MANPFPLAPRRPERLCWGCDRDCAAHGLACGNGAGRTLHPSETQGEDWYVAWDIAADPARPAHARLGDA
ncbi:DUF3079 domain-containing protein [Xanthomonas sp. LMG 12460]|uniref:DUF3079 domain-containing protein n=1 Tax=Xanthomonas sp. LMG 12460 TaxID=1591132 RepID=UPI0012651737|nr:DUF3079 domain-containing protein [Xanthomonas sp. LMG 12460]KAB7781471.1 hypothetical protein CEK66_00645 [Xanthomonas sp. LMG 12460]